MVEWHLVEGSEKGGGEGGVVVEVSSVRRRLWVSEGEDGGVERCGEVMEIGG